MSIKSTQSITREKALEILLEEVPNLPNDALANLLDALADTRESRRISQFDNFIVSEFGFSDADSEGRKKDKSFKSTHRVTREKALEILLEEMPNLSNAALEALMDLLADIEQCHRISEFDNFAVHDAD